jgi:uncharacterized membrane protein
MQTGQLKDTWTDTWNSPRKRGRIIIGTVIMLVVVFIMPSFFGYIEKRQGVSMNDWLLAQIPPHNVSVLIFSIIWGMILFAVVRAIYNPSIYIIYCWSLIFVTIARFTCIALVPLAPPLGLIPLTDPITSVFYGHALITKDLFFSGHTATLTLIVLCLERKTDKLIATAGTIIVAFLLLVQHIHYSIDVFAAPVIVYAIYRTTRYFLYKNKSLSKTRRFAKVVKMPKKEVLAKVFSEGK